MATLSSKKWRKKSLRAHRGTRARQKDDVTAAIGGSETAAAPAAYLFSHLRSAPSCEAEDDPGAGARSHRSMIRYGRQHVGEVEFSAEDAGRTDIGFLCQGMPCGRGCGATVLNRRTRWDTRCGRVRCGRCSPKVPSTSATRRELRSARIATRPGMAVANSLAAIPRRRTADRCTINGIGERAGNASLEESSRGAGSAQGQLRGYDGLRMQELFPRAHAH